MTTRGSQALSWDHENRLASVSGGVIKSYLYDAEGMRVKKTSDGVDSYYPFPHYELHDGVVVKYYFFGGMRVAQRRDGVLTYLHGNHWMASGNAAVTLAREGRQIGYPDTSADIWMGIEAGIIGAELAAARISIDQVGAVTHAALQD